MCVETACFPLLSIEQWAAKGDMPETKAHFAKVIAQIKPVTDPSYTPSPECGSTCSNYDMARCASEVKLELR